MVGSKLKCVDPHRNVWWRKCLGHHEAIPQGHWIITQARRSFKLWKILPPRTSTQILYAHSRIYLSKKKNLITIFQKFYNHKKQHMHIACELQTLEVCSVCARAPHATWVCLCVGSMWMWVCENVYVIVCDCRRVVYTTLVQKNLDNYIQFNSSKAKVASLMGFFLVCLGASGSTYAHQLIPFMVRLKADHSRQD